LRFLLAAKMAGSCCSGATPNQRVRDNNITNASKIGRPLTDAMSFTRNDNQPLDSPWGA